MSNRPKLILKEGIVFALELQGSERLRTFKLAGIECLTDTSPFQEVYLFNILCDLFVRFRIVNVNLL